MNALVPKDWLVTPLGDRRGYIQPHTLSELWFHIGTACNLACPFCLEGSKPGDTRLGRVSFADVKPFIDEAVALGVRQFSFTGGEPFIIKDLIRILDYALGFNPCLVLTNGTDALIKRMGQLEALREKPHALSLRVSIDHPDAARHDAGRGADMFATSFQALQMLHARGFRFSIARQMEKTEDRASVDTAFRRLFRDFGLPEDLHIVAFPDFATPGSILQVPVVTEGCMTRYQTESSRREFMCAYSKMVIKLGGRMRVYACTLRRRRPRVRSGREPARSARDRVMMRHHRCYSCFAYGASCSETREH